jgi:CheY-like chemotaxis protein
MNSILVRAVSRDVSLRGHILAIEPDAARAAVLRSVLSHDLEFHVVPGCTHAIERITEDVPDLVLTSTLLPPADVSALADHVGRTPGASHVQIVDVPYFIDLEDARDDERKGNVLGFLRGRPRQPKPRCDVDTFCEHVEAYLAQARSVRAGNLAEGVDAEALAARLAARDPAGQELQTGLVRAAPLEIVRTDLGHRTDRRRALRKRATEVPTLWGVRLPWGADARVLDISTSGVLMESPVKLTPGSTVDLHLLGQGTNLCVPSRTVRAEVGDVDPLGVKYRIGATFSRELDLAGLDRALTPALSVRTLVDLVARMAGEADRAAPGGLRQRFESELGRLFEVEEIRIRERPAVAPAAGESIYFSVPEGPGPDAVLQVTFGADSQVSAGQFRLLRTAATLSRVVLELEALAG